MLNEIRNTLLMLGLNTNAIEFYLTSYKIGFASVGKIAQSSGIDRSSSYLALDQLRALGLIDEKKNNNRALVCVCPPQVLQDKLQMQAIKFKNQSNLIEAQLPNLLAEYSRKDNQPVLQFFSGKDGMKRIENDILDYCQDELLVYSNQKEERMVFDKIDHKEFIKERVKKNIRARVLSPDTAEAHELKEKDHCSLRETRIITEKEAPFTNEIYVYNDKIAMLEFVDEVQGFIIKSKAFAETQKWLFEKLWKIYG